MSVNNIDTLAESGLVTETQLSIWAMLYNADEPCNIFQCWTFLGGNMRLNKLKSELSKMISLGIVKTAQDEAGVNYYKLADK